MDLTDYELREILSIIETLNGLSRAWVSLGDVPIIDSNGETVGLVTFASEGSGYIFQPVAT